MNAAAVFNSLWASMPEARAMIRKGRSVISKAMTSGVETTRQDSEYGQAVATGIYIRFLKADEPADGISTGNEVDVKMATETAWKTFRVAGRIDIGGQVRLALEAEFA